MRSSPPLLTMDHDSLPRPTPTRMTQYLSTKKPGVPVICVDRIRFLHSTHCDSSNSDSSSSCSTTTRGRRRFRKRPLRERSPVVHCRHIESGVMEVIIGRRESTLLTNAAAIQQDDDSSFSSLSSYESGAESESEDEEDRLRKMSMNSQISSLVDGEELIDLRLFKR